MNIVYLCNFNLNNYSGKDRATRQKLEALGGLVDNLKVFSLEGDNKIYKLIQGVILDIKCSHYILTHKPQIFISRGLTGYLSYLTSRALNITTVREVHALSQNEVNLLKHNFFEKFIISYLGRASHKLDCLVDVRIFNHPFLLDYYKLKGWSNSNDFYCYNGYSEESIVPLKKEEARRKFSLDINATYLVFTGSVSKWHGAEYLVKLQEEFNKFNDNITIIVGGGSLSEYDANNICLNITPLNDIGCSELISAADACLLPVKNNRISPGSPLKLYDYIANEKPIIAQSIIGYSDEVEKYDFGISVDFNDVSKTRIEVINYLDEIKHHGFNHRNANVKWKDRMTTWINNLIKI